jgi:NADH-quinone oxidoreductase subunit I
MGYFKDIADGLLSAAKGMKITFAHLGEKSNTVQWPHEPATTKPRTRSELFNNIEDCIGCNRCAVICPVDCIMISTIKTTKAVDLGKTSNGKKKALYLSQFDIDMAKCCYCGLCTDVCPTHCLIMTEKFDYSQATLEGLYYRFSKMDETEISKVSADLAEEKKAMAAAKAAAKAKADAEKKAAEAEAAKEKTDDKKADDKSAPISGENPVTES